MFLQEHSTHLQSHFILSQVIYLFLMIPTLQNSKWMLQCSSEGQQDKQISASKNWGQAWCRVTKQRIQHPCGLSRAVPGSHLSTLGWKGSQGGSPIPAMSWSQLLLPLNWAVPLLTLTLAPVPQSCCCSQSQICRGAVTAAILANSQNSVSFPSSQVSQWRFILSRLS